MSSSNDYILSKYEPVIGLEVHCQLQTASKLFCGCSTKFGVGANENTCPVCLGLPGALPVLNQKAIRSAVILAIAVRGEVRQISTFARKQYFYPDLPKGYQISQFDQPYCVGGQIKLGNGKIIELERIHIEEDAGKSIHAGLSSHIDLNRAGIPLVEIVSKPMISNAEEASDYLRKLRSLVRHLRISDGNLEEGSFRCDVNLSLRLRGSSQLGTRCEIKNINSFRNVERAIQYEIVRQADILDANQKVIQSTLLFDAASGKTQLMRTKEESQDYRYFPDPDLPRLQLNQELLDEIMLGMPELPQSKSDRYEKNYSLSPYDAAFLTSEPEIAQFFESVISFNGVKPGQTLLPAKTVCNWLMTEFMREANLRDGSINSVPVTAEHLFELLQFTEANVISNRMAKAVFAKMVEQRLSPAQIIKEAGMTQVSDTAKIRESVLEVLKNHPAQVAEYRAGKEKVYGYLFGQVMKAGDGKLNPELVKSILQEALKID